MRMESILGDSEAGRKRQRMADDRINHYLADKLEESVKERRTEASSQGTSQPSNLPRESTNTEITDMDMEQDTTDNNKRKREDRDEEDIIMEDVNFVGPSDMCAPDNELIQDSHND